MLYRLNILLFLCFYLAATSQVSEQWASRYTGNGNNIDAAADIAVDGSGNTYVTGTSWSTNGNFDILTVKYDDQGNQSWIASYNGNGNAYDESRAVGFDPSGNVYVAGYADMGSANYDYVLIKYNSSGVQQWVVTYNGTGNGFDEVYDLAVDVTGNAFITGGSDAGGASSNYVTIMYNTSGVQQWVASYNGPGNDIDAAFAIILDGLGSVYVTGHSMGSGSDFDYATVKYNPAGIEQWVARYNGTGNLFDAASAITMDNSGNIIVTGFSYGNGSDNDYATVKYNQSGNQLWAMRYNGPGNDYDKANAITTDANDNVYVTGRCFGSGTGQDYATIKYTSSGVEEWVKIYNGSVGNGYDEATGITYDGLDGIYLTGASKNTGTNNDYVTIKYDTLGNQEWLIAYDGPASDNDQALALAIDGIGNVYVTGKSVGINSNTDYATIKYCQLTASVSSDTSICVGDTVMLSASGGTSYLWSPSAGLDNPSSATPNAFPSTTTTYVVTVTNANACTDVDSVTVVVNPLPGPNIYASGSTEFCTGDSVILSTDTASLYLWNTGDTTISIVVYNSGNYTITIVDSMGCQNSTQQSVTSYALPAVDAGLDDTICLGKSTTLNAFGAFTYIWTPGQSLDDSTSINPTAIPDTTTTYFLNGTDTNNCVNSDSVTIVVNQIPVKPIISYVIPNLVSTPALTYQWWLNGVPVNGATNQSHQPQYNGDYQVEISDANGCTNISDIYNVTGIGFDDLHANHDIQIFPNPSGGKVTILLPHNISGKLEIEISDVAGKVCYHEIIANSESKERVFLDLDFLAQGIYGLRINSELGTIHRKLLMR